VVAGVVDGFGDGHSRPGADTFVECLGVEPAAGYVSPPTFLAVRWLLAQFSGDPRRAALRYVEFVADGIATPGRVQGPGPWTRL